LNAECGLTIQKVVEGYQALTDDPSEEICLIKKGLEASDWLGWRAKVDKQFGPLMVWERRYTEDEFPKIEKDSKEIEAKQKILFENLKKREENEGKMYKRFEKLCDQLKEKYEIEIKLPWIYKSKS
jgi:hypothetical protein